MKKAVSNIKNVDPNYCFLLDRESFPINSFQVYPRLGGWDMDVKSSTLKSYHSLLWSRETPSGTILKLEHEKKSSGYLVWNNHSFGSDQIMATFRYKALTDFFEKTIIPESENFEERMRRFIVSCGTMPGIMLWPKHINSMNQVRGTNIYIRDRFDLTLRCIQLYYDKSSLFNPLEKYLKEDDWFYDLFVSFHGFLEFFFLQDLVDDNGSIIYFSDFTEFTENPFPKSTSDYWAFIDNQQSFLEKRRNRMQNFITSCNL